MIPNLLIKSRVTEVDAASMRMIGAYQTTSLNTDAYLPGMFSELETLSASLTSAINRSKAESDLEAKDEVRDNQVRALFYLVTGFLHHPDNVVKSAAETVNKVFEKYGVAITGESYATESSLITSLLDDLSKQKQQDAIALLPGCPEVLLALENAQTAFEAARIEYEQEKARERTQLNATKIKAAVVALINERIVVYLRAMETVDNNTYGTFARNITVIIDENNEAVKKRRKKEEPETE